MSIFKKADRMPSHSVDAVIVLSYSVAEEDPFRLTRMSEACLEAGIVIYHDKLARNLIFTAAHQTAQYEAKKKMRIARDQGVAYDDIRVIMPVTDTFDEAEKAKAMLPVYNFRSVLLVAEARHMPRAYRIFREVLPKAVALYNYSVEVPYEPEYYGEPDGLSKTLKQLRSRYLPLRLLAEWGMNLALPLIMWRRWKKKGGV